MTVDVPLAPLFCFRWVRERAPRRLFGLSTSSSPLIVIMSQPASTTPPRCVLLTRQSLVCLPGAHRFVLLCCLNERECSTSSAAGLVLHLRLVEGQQYTSLLCRARSGGQQCAHWHHCRGYCCRSRCSDGPRWPLLAAVHATLQRQA